MLQIRNVRQPLYNLDWDGPLKQIFTLIFYTFFKINQSYFTDHHWPPRPLMLFLLPNVLLCWNILFDFQLLLPWEIEKVFLQGSVFLNVISHYGMSLFWVFMELDHELIQRPKLMKKVLSLSIVCLWKHVAAVLTRLHCLPIDFSWQI